MDEIVPLTLGTRVYDRLGNRWLWLKHRTPDGGIEYQCERPYFQSRPRPGGWVFGGTLTTEGIKWLSLTNSSDQALSLESVREEAVLTHRLKRIAYVLGMEVMQSGNADALDDEARAAMNEAIGFGKDRAVLFDNEPRTLQHAPARVAEGSVPPGGWNNRLTQLRIAVATRNPKKEILQMIDDLLDPFVETDSPQGSYSCPICDKDTPHTHPTAPESPAKEQPGEQKLGQGWIPVSEDLKLAKEVLERDDKDNRGSRILRPGVTDEYRLARALLDYAKALQEAASIGIADLFAYCGAYESLNPHKRKTWDRLNKLHAMCDGLPPPPERP